MTRTALILALSAFFLADTQEAFAQKHMRSMPRDRYNKARGKTSGKTSTKSGSKRSSDEITVPVNVGVGPALFTLTGPVADDQFWHYGLRLDVFAALSPELIRENLHRVPRQYRSMAKGIKTEVRYSPLWFLPESLIISPSDTTDIYGVNFKPIDLGITLNESPRLSVSAGLLLSYAYISSETLESPTHFLRPGLGLSAELEFPIADAFRVSVGWQSSLYPPQTVGGPVFEWGDLDDSIWHIGQAFLLLHFRFPYTTSL